MKTATSIEVTRTYLEMRDPADLHPARSDDSAHSRRAVALNAPRHSFVIYMLR